MPCLYAMCLRSSIWRSNIWIGFHVCGFIGRSNTESGAEWSLPMSYFHTPARAMYASHAVPTSLVSVLLLYEKYTHGIPLALAVLHAQYALSMGAPPRFFMFSGVYGMPSGHGSNFPRETLDMSFFIDETSFSTEYGAMLGLRSPLSSSIGPPTPITHISSPTVSLSSGKMRVDGFSVK